jgi:hypothetical protein
VQTEPVPVSEGTYALFSQPDGSLVIAYWAEGASESEQVAIPAELVPALQMLRENPAALLNISNSPMGAVARRMVGQLTKKAASDGG